MKNSNPNVTNVGNLKPLADPRYGKVLVVDSPEAVLLRKLDVAYAVVNPGATSPAHYHKSTEEVYAIVKGGATIVIDGITTPVGPGDIVRIPVFTVHSITAGPDGCEFWVSTTPPYCLDDDIETDAVKVAKAVVTNITDSASSKIAVIIGTHRKNAVSAKVARQIVDMYADLGIATDLIDPSELPLDIFNPDAFDHRYETDSALAQRFITATGLVFVTPEYNGSFAGVIKHILDVQNYEKCFGGKAVCLVGVAAGDFGGLRAVDQLSQVLSYRSAHLYGKKVLIRNVDEAVVDERGYLTDPKITERLRSQAAGFAHFVWALASARA